MLGPLAKSIPDYLRAGEGAPLPSTVTGAGVAQDGRGEGARAGGQSQTGFEGGGGGAGGHGQPYTLRYLTLRIVF